MFKLNLVLFISLFTSIISAQKFEGYVITKVNDTIHCKFLIETNIFNDEIFYANSIRNKVKVLTKNNEKIVYVPSQLKEFLIKRTGGDFKFVSFSEDGFKYFYHEVIKGKLSYYKLYKADLYSGGANSGYDVFIFKENKFKKLSAFNQRKSLSEVISDYPELYEKWIDSNNYYKVYQREEVVKLYNEHFKN
jgi:hypothetical protein